MSSHDGLDHQRRFTNNQSELDVDGKNIKEVLDQLFNNHQDIQKHLNQLWSKHLFL